MLILLRILLVAFISHKFNLNASLGGYVLIFWKISGVLPSRYAPFFWGIMNFNLSLFISWKIWVRYDYISYSYSKWYMNGKMCAYVCPCTLIYTNKIKFLQLHIVRLHFQFGNMLHFICLNLQVFVLAKFVSVCNKETLK